MPNALLGCDQFVAKHKPGKPNNVVSVDFCDCNLPIREILKMVNNKLINLYQMISEADILQTNATIIAGILIFLTYFDIFP